MSFSLDLRRAIENIQEDAERVVRGTLFSVSSMIIRGTPVGNPDLWKDPPPPGYVGGTLRGSWQASIGSPERARIDRIDKTGDSTISDMANTAMNLEMGQTFYLTNAQPYAYRVEYGWSSQRPQGMVRVAVMQAQQEVDRLAR